MRLCSIASGSSGNCIYVGSDNTHLLIDAGISAKRVVQGVEELGIKPEELSGILITHEHSDHIQGLGVFSRKYNIPIYGTEGTLQAIEGCTTLGEYDKNLHRVIHTDEAFSISDLEIMPFKISHDAKQPCAYVVQKEGKRVAVATDMGTYDEYVISHLQNVNGLLLESNHDVNMLQVGTYPYYLKQRILGNYGHLSNENAGRLLCRLLHDGMKGINLGHLSKENNYDRLAYETVNMEITLGDCPYKGSDFPIQVAKRDVISDIIYV